MIINENEVAACGKRVSFSGLVYRFESFIFYLAYIIRMVPGVLECMYNSGNTR